MKHSSWKWDGTPPKVNLYTDGSSLGNPGDGGWAAVLVQGKNRKELSGYEPDTTNNRMEVMAVIEGLKALKRPCYVYLVSDSKYVINAINDWMDGWERKGWKDAKGKEIKNLELMQELNELRKTHEIQPKWIKGHTGHRENERCDKLAVSAAKQKGK